MRSIMQWSSHLIAVLRRFAQQPAREDGDVCVHLTFRRLGHGEREAPLVVRGHTTRPFQIIILDGHYKRRSNRDGRFIFRVPYRPRFCKIDLASGSEIKSVEVRNCSTNIRRLPRLKSV